MSVPIETHPHARGIQSAAPRIVNVILGAWLIASAFVWPHTAS